MDPKVKKLERNIVDSASPIKPVNRSISESKDDIKDDIKKAKKVVRFSEDKFFDDPLPLKKLPNGTQPILDSVPEDNLDNNKDSLLSNEPEDNLENHEDILLSNEPTDDEPDPE